MAIDPNDLLIFKVREQEKKKSAQAEKKPEVKVEAQPKPVQVEKKPEQKPVEAASKPFFLFHKKEEAKRPVIEEKAVPKVEAQPKPERKPFTLFHKKEEKAAEQQKRQPEETFYKQRAVAEEQVYRPKQPIYQKPVEAEKKEMQTYRKPAAAPESPTMRSIYASVQSEAEQQLETAMRNEAGDFAAKELINKKKPKDTRTEEESLAAAKDRFCTWHQWRPAYAICNYCHRPFCFEDTTEFNGAFYCLEDIDKVSAGRVVQNAGLAYNNKSIIASTLMFVTFIAFMYFANAQLGYIVSYANSVGMVRFLNAISASYAFALLESVITFFTLVSAILILAQSRKGYYIGLGTCFANVAIFSYQYLNTSTLYLLVISILSFASLIILAYSRSAFEEREPLLNANQYQMEWPNVGRF